MKDAEDEAFDELAKRQGAWGGGYQAKRKAASDKQHWNEDEWRKNNWRCGHGWLRGEQCEICNAAQPVQEPPSEWAGIKAILNEYGLQAIDFVADFKAALAQREWVDLSDSQIEQVYYDVAKLHRGAPMPYGQVVFGRAVQVRLKELNNG